MPKTDAERQKLRRDKLKDNGYIWFGVWIKPEWKQQIERLINKLRGE